MEIENIRKLIQDNYDINIQNTEIFRESSNGNCTYAVYNTDKKYFFKAVNNLAVQEMETALSSIDIQLYLMQSDVPAIPIIFTKDELPCIRINKQDKKYMYVMYEFIDGSGDPRSMIKAGEALGKIHHVMKNYTGRLVERSKYYFIDRYVGLMRKHQYPRAEFFGEYGNELWDKIKNLPRGYCHCDLYDGNMLKAKENDKIYLVDFDTSCMGFPMYDMTLFCNRTNYFKYDYKGYERTRIRLEKFLTGYQRYNTISDEEISAVWHMLAVYHFQLCSQGIERDGYLTDQNACSSPRIIFWFGEKTKDAQDVFWHSLNEQFLHDYVMPTIITVDKLVIACRYAAANECRIISTSDYKLVRVRPQNISASIFASFANCGFFYEYDINAIDEILPVCTRECQTLSYIGFDKNELKRVVLNNSAFGIDRIVPVGKTMDFGLIWDGVDLIRELSRIIVTR